MSSNIYNNGHSLDQTKIEKERDIKYTIDPARFQRYFKQQLVKMPQVRQSNPQNFANHLAFKYLKLKGNKSQQFQTKEEKKEVRPPPNILQVIHLPAISQYKYVYFLGMGNNQRLIQKVMSTRPEWTYTANHTDPTINFKWQQTNSGYLYDRMGQKTQQILNHFEFHQEISQKHNLLRNLLQFCEFNKIDVFDMIPITFELDFTQDRCDYQLQTFLNYYEKNAPDHMKSSDAPRRFFMIRRMLQTYQLIAETPKLLSTQIPATFIGYDYLWILKPTQLNRGKGIHIIKNLEKMAQIIDSYSSGQGKTRSFVIQKYMEQPLLIRQRKFDIRVWCLLTNEMELYFFQEGYIRLSSEIFNIRNIDNQYIHLTNNAIQKNNPNYGNFEEGNQLSFESANVYFKQKFDFYKVIEKIKKLCYIAFCSVKRKINYHQRKNCFEIFGIDFMIDQLHKPWLIEVNTNPCLEESSALLQQLLPRMIDNAFELTTDKLFKTEKLRRFPVTNYSDSQNMWQSLGKLMDKLQQQ